MSFGVCCIITGLLQCAKKKEAETYQPDSMDRRFHVDSKQATPVYFNTLSFNSHSDTVYIFPLPPIVFTSIFTQPLSGSR